MDQLTMDNLPPYGWMWDDWQEAANRCEAPRYWADAAGLPDWPAWFAATRKIIRDDIWPEFVIGQGWQGNSRSHALHMTGVELDLMAQFRALQYEAQAWPADIVISTNAKLFLVEDIENWERTLTRYCPELLPRRDDWALVMDESIQRRAGKVSQCLKFVFQRPRAFQVSMLLGRTQQFHWGFARSSISPAMVSGHCLHACIVGCLVHARLLAADAALAVSLREAVQGWSMGIADRRVMAGVHYPTDNIASWIVALRLAERVIPGPAVVPFLREAITQRSPLYRFLAEQRARNPAVDAALARPWAALEAALG